ncbi:DUF4870 domain-containing protein [Phycisphaerales bacterium AB-hyl4]|uniref:DUF4870 domain-containing protein n=1 Tax=Natronomicrosphaera hydrolytica TaxID=3242702 RepID=A0ABV4U0Q6_9BACT
MALVAHLLGILLSVIGPLIIWLIKKDDSKFVDDQGKEALNFQITILIAYLISSVLTTVLIGCLLLPIVIIVNIVFCIIAAMKSKEGIRYRYPFALRLIS